MQNETNDKTTPNNQPSDSTSDALKHLFKVACTLIIALATIYTIPALSRFRPWTPGDRIPFSQLFREQTSGASIAATGGSSEADTLVNNFPVNQVNQIESQSNLNYQTQISPNEYTDIKQRIEDPNGQGMRSFYESLLRTAQQEPHSLTRIGHYGDSSIALDSITHTIRRLMQQRFGDGGHGFMLASKGYLPYRHKDVLHEENGAWRIRELTRAAANDGHYGYGGIPAIGGPNARASFAPDPNGPIGKTVSRFQIFYQRHQNGGSFEFLLDRSSPKVIDTQSSKLEDAVETIDVIDGDHHLEIRGHEGTFTLYGVVLEREGPGVVYDSIGLVGARANRLLNFDREHITAQIRSRDMNLLILGFGGNEASDHIDRTRYEREFRQVIEHMRSESSQLSCLIVAPLDQADSMGRTFRALPMIVEIQRKVALEKGCAFFDTWHAMGGSGSMTRWLHTRPRLAVGDGRHAAPEGYARIGQLLYKALIAGFADYLHTRGNH